MNIFKIPELIKRIAIYNYLTIIKLQRVCNKFRAILCDENITEKRESHHEFYPNIFYSISYIIGTNIRHGKCITLNDNTYWCEEFVFGMQHGKSIMIRDDGYYMEDQYWKNYLYEEKIKILF
jgi:hypothetical protein